mmetsp:Transcript_214/g.336  ORF Transcript_214/g.336 Transcript_214/m.336 type:complete len:83 (-) Transcript_214:20-268(-)
MCLLRVTAHKNYVSTLLDQCMRALAFLALLGAGWGMRTPSPYSDYARNFQPLPPPKDSKRNNTIDATLVSAYKLDGNLLKCI